MINLAKSKVPEALFFVKDIRKPLDFDTLFNGIFAQAVLLHVPKKEIIEVIKNVIAPLKEGGYFYVAVKETRPGQPDEQILTEGDYGYSYERFFSFFTQSEMENYLKQVGLTVVFSHNILNGKTTWIQIIAKK